MRSKFLWITLLIMVALFSSCKKDDSKTDDSDQMTTDSENVSDTSVDESQNDENVTDSSNDTADNSVTDEETTDTDSTNICDPNPCDTPENREKYRTRCMPENEGTSYVCLCDTDHHESDGICCQPYSSNVSGKCECNTYYVAPADDPETCVAECTEDTIEGFNGYCVPGEVCQQGICIKDWCYQ